MPRSLDQGVGAWPGDETLARCRADKWPEGRTPWDGPRPGEDTKFIKTRHGIAQRACRGCLLIEACEEALSDMEKEDLHVDGVMAGRYSDVPAYGLPTAQRKIFRQNNCKFCGTPMRPQAPSKEWDKRSQAITAPIAWHMGEGLCEGCFPTKNRKARRVPIRRKHTPNHNLRLEWEAIA